MGIMNEVFQKWKSLIERGNNDKDRKPEHKDEEEKKRNIWNKILGQGQNNTENRLKTFADGCWMITQTYIPTKPPAIMGA